MRSKRPKLEAMYDRLGKLKVFFRLRLATCCKSHLLALRLGPCMVLVVVLLSGFKSAVAVS